jgi:hypothetical protein
MRAPSHGGEVKQSPVDEVPRLLAEDPDMVCVAPDERFVVLYAVSYEHTNAPLSAGGYLRTPRDAAHHALELTRGEGSEHTTWYVYDTVLRTWSTFAQSEIELP